jgi:hypothetical protein
MTSDAFRIDALTALPGASERVISILLVSIHPL